MRSRFQALFSVLVMIAALATSQNASAQDHAAITISAELAGSFKVSFCGDLTADFGTGHTWDGDAPADTTDRIGVIGRGNAGVNGGVVYVWVPTCTTGGFL